MKLKKITGALLVLLMISCAGSQHKFPQADISYSAVNVSIHRYGKTLFELDTTDFRNQLKSIQKEFLPFLDADLDQPENIIQLLDFVSDSQLRTIYNKTITV